MDFRIFLRSKFLKIFLEFLEGASLDCDGVCFCFLAALFLFLYIFTRSLKRSRTEERSCRNGCSREQRQFCDSPAASFDGGGISNFKFEEKNLLAALRPLSLPASPPVPSSPISSVVVRWPHRPSRTVLAPPSSPSEIHGLAAAFDRPPCRRHRHSSYGKT